MESAYLPTPHHSSSINNAFISTVDHLPCDVIRSLWLIQSCNIESNSCKEHLDGIMRKIQVNPSVYKSDKPTIKRMVSLQDKIRSLEAESLQEGKALYNQLITHKTALIDELNQLKSLIKVSRDPNEAEASTEPSDTPGKESAETLRKQLLDHYKENPLRSQVEALKEQEEQRKEEEIEQKEQQKKAQIKLKLKAKSKMSEKASDSHPRLLLKIPISGGIRKMKKKSKNNAETRGGARKYSAGEIAQKLKQEAQQHLANAAEEALLEEEDAEDPNTPYCFCKQPSFGDMIGCDNEESCPNGDWFHYKCVGLTKVEAAKYANGKEKWFCSEGCRKASAEKQEASKLKSKKKKKRRW